MKRKWLVIVCGLAAMSLPAWAGETEWRAHTAAGEAAVHKGDFALAERRHQQAVAEAESAFGGGHPNVAKSVHDLAGVHWLQHQYAQAEKLYRRSLAIREKALGEAHPEVVQDLQMIGWTCLHQGRSAEAELYFKRSLAIWEKARGMQDAGIPNLLLNLSELHMRQGRHAEAEPLLARCLDLIELTLADKSFDHEGNLSDAAGFLEEIYKKQGRQSEIASLRQRRFAIGQKLQAQAR